MENNRCPNCGILLREDFRFCPSCGQPLNRVLPNPSEPLKDDTTTPPPISFSERQSLSKPHGTSVPAQPGHVPTQDFVSATTEEQPYLARMLPAQPLPPFLTKTDVFSGLYYWFAVSIGLLLRYILLTDSLLSFSQIVDSLRGGFLVALTVFIILKVVTRSNAYYAEFTFSSDSFASVMAGTSIFLGYLPDIAKLKKTKLPPQQKGKIATFTSLWIFVSSIIYLYLGYALSPLSGTPALLLGNNSGSLSVLWMSGQVMAAIAFVMTISAPFSFGNEMSMSNPRIQSLVRIGSFIVLFFGLSSQGQSLLPSIA